ncbi:MAG: hypothetical protein H6766_05285 [Candidatus Peribacteria bacterium]|nr:MAG: hypothetical protein H6766_05285 [Candidatus Peribacteria bacterium]
MTQVDPDQLLTGVVTFVIEEDYSIIAHQTNNLQATPLVVSSHIKTPSPEVTTTDNHAYDTITPVLKDHSSIAGRTYIDVDGSQSYTSFDQVMRDTRVCISGIDVMGGIIDQCQDTNNEGEYVISGLLPGTYELLWIPTSLTGSYSSAGTLYHLVSDGSNPVRVGE